MFLNTQPVYTTGFIAAEIQDSRCARLYNGCASPVGELNLQLLHYQPRPTMPRCWGHHSPSFSLWKY
uniref:Uncharacterized protein n=1 Tax=Anguilla anguilla TaxID=7936 RepID=A0A0E9RMJ9_ANGAN